MISVQSLQPADILLSTGNAGYSAVIRAGTVSRYSHATLYIGDGRVVESIARGVTLQSLNDALADDTLVTVYRRMRMSKEQAAQVIRYARQAVGKNYDLPGAVGGGATSPTGFAIGLFVSPIVASAGLDASKRNASDPEACFYCSELVALAFESAGVSLGSRGSNTTPGDIGRSHVLNRVGDLQKAAAPRLARGARRLASFALRP
jgi:uncharacterized protein YycO